MVLSYFKESGPRTEDRGPSISRLTKELVHTDEEASGRLGTDKGSTGTGGVCELFGD